MRDYESFFNENYNTSEIWRTYPCNYIAVMESAAFNFSTTYLTSTVFYDTDNSKKPVVMEWGISRNSCAEAKNDTATYACVSNNSDCVTNEAGYHCRCSGGYQGNPYIVDGCKGSSPVLFKPFFFSCVLYIFFLFISLLFMEYVLQFSDIDECLDKFAYPCSGICKNTEGGFTCSCPHGKSMINGLCVQNQKSVWVAPVVGKVAKLQLRILKPPPTLLLLFSLLFFGCHLSQHLAYFSE